jgi:hypothetical protein
VARGALARRHRRARAHDRRGGRDVVGQFLQQLGVPLGLLLERAGLAVMQLGPRRGVQPRIQPVADQHVGEALPAVLARGQHQSSARRRIDERDRFARLDAEQSRNAGDREVAPDDRGGGQRVRRGAGQLLQPARDGLADTGRQLEPGVRGAGGGERLDEERVALGARDEPVDGRARQLRPRARQRERPRRGRVEPGERDVRAAAHQRAEHPLDPGVGADIAPAERRDDEQRRGREPRREQLEQAQRCGVGRVEVIERDQQRLRGRARQQELSNPVEQGEASAGVGRRSVAARRQLLQLRGLALPRELAEHLDPRPERRGPAGLPAAAPHRSVVGGGGLHEARLADPGLAGHQHEPAAATAGRRAGLAQLRELCITADEHRVRLYVGAPHCTNRAGPRYAPPLDT